MNRTRLIARHPGYFALLIAAMMLVALFAATSPVRLALAAQDFGEEEPGRHVYDEAGLLNSAEVEDLESRAAAVEAAGTPTVVYLRTREADYDATEQDAKELMEAWDVQSRQNARDGLVIFLNFEPDNPRHGQVSLYAGRSLREGGPLPRPELERISDREIRPLLAEERTAEGIGAGLDAVTQDIESGPSPPGPMESEAAMLVRTPASVIAALCAAGIVWLVVRARRERPAPGRSGGATTTPPDDLAPALVGALLGRGTSNERAEATILDLARRGALTIKPDEEAEKSRVRLLDRSALRSPHEERVWEALREHADDEGVVASEDMPRSYVDWIPMRDELQRELFSRGWYDPNAGAKRRPFYLAGTASLLLAAATFAATVIGQEPWGYLPTAVLLVSGAGSILYARHCLPETTAEGEGRPARWRGYLAGLESTRRAPSIELDLDEAMPYAVALGAANILEGRLESASSRGYTPAWFGPRASDEAWDGGFYPHWVGFHAALMPPPAYSEAAGGYAHAGAGGASAGGASAGGGGAGGGF